jgi:hypothetical protein
LPNPRQSVRASREVRVDLWLERHSAGGAGENNLSWRDAFNTPITHRLPLATDHRLGAGDRKNRQVTPGLDDDPSQPHIREIEIGGLITPRRRLTGRAEQRVTEDRRDKLIDLWALRAGLALCRLSSRSRLDGRLVGIAGVQFHKDHRAKQRTSGQEQDDNPVDHRCDPPAASLPRMPYTSNVASSLALAPMTPGRLTLRIWRLSRMRGGTEASIELNSLTRF